MIVMGMREKNLLKTIPLTIIPLTTPLDCVVAVWTEECHLSDGVRHGQAFLEAPLPWRSHSVWKIPTKLEDAQ